MVNYSAAQQYQQNSVLTSTPGELTLLLYSGLVKSLKSSILEHDKGNREGVNKHLLKSQDILRELQCTLDMKYEIAHNLAALYDFMLDQLVQANIHLDRSTIETVLGLAEEFRDTWAQAIKLAK